MPTYMQILAAIAKDFGPVIAETLQLLLEHSLGGPETNPSKPITVAHAGLMHQWKAEFLK